MLQVIPLIFLYTITAVADRDDTHCPCQIYVNEIDRRVADCNRRHMTTIPNCVPNNTQVLDIVSNNLRYSPGQFQRFGNLMVLNLSNNTEFAAHNDSFQFLYKLEQLYLKETNLTYLNGETFLYQSKLRELDLRGTVGHLNVRQSLFDHLRSLEILNLGNKGERYFTLPNWAFVRLHLLRDLDISFTIFLRLENNTFSGLTALKYLNLQDSLGAINLPGDVFKPLTSLEELHLEGLCADMRFVPFDCKTIDDRLQHVPSLKRFYSDTKMISYLGRGFLSLKNLQELYLVNGIISETCEIVELEPDVFINLTDSPLAKLVVSHCNFGGVSPQWSHYLPELKEISLSFTTLVYFSDWESFSFGIENTDINKVRLSLRPIPFYSEPDPFLVADGFNQSRLTSLELTDTPFYWVDDNIISKLPKSLNYLNLTHNYIIYFGVERIKYLENLETLDLSNQVEFQEQSSTEKIYDTHKCSPRLKRQELLLPLRKEDCNIQRMTSLQDKIQKRLNVTKAACISLPYRLKTLDVSKSGLLCNFVPAFCDSRNSLEILNASEQREKSCFETRSFWSVLKNLANLVELNLNENSITEIPKDSFSGLFKLRKLLLHENKLLELSFDVKDLISLETLDLSANSILYASNSFASQIDDISRKTNLTLYLDVNRLVCNCKHLDLVSWLMVTQAISNKNKLNCTFENETQINIGRISHAHDILKYKCTRLDVTIGCTVTFWGLNIILGGLAYIWHSRKNLKYLVSFGRRTLNPYHPIEDHDIEMEYDVYISYEGDFNVTRDKTLRDFVIYTILPGLEQRGVKVMIREELDAGRNLYEVITQTVRRSKKVVAFLTNGFCQDMWNVFEFNQAVMEGIYTNRQVAIPVLFESLRQQQVKEEICEFLQMEPVHKYSPELSDRAFIDFLYERIRDTRQFG